MSQTLHQFSLRLLIISLALALITFGLTYVVPLQFISPVWPFIIGFFFALTLLVHRFLLKKSDINPGKFINAFMLSTTVKLLLYLTIIMVYVLLNRDDAIGFILTFFVYYLVYTIYEIISILGVLRKSQQK